jgi:hypothetical protein
VFSIVLAPCWCHVETVLGLFIEVPKFSKLLSPISTEKLNSTHFHSTEGLLTGAYSLFWAGDFVYDEEKNWLRGKNLPKKMAQPLFQFPRALFEP